MSEKRPSRRHTDDDDPFEDGGGLGSLLIVLAAAGAALAIGYIAALGVGNDLTSMVASFGIEPKAARIIAYGLVVVPVTAAVFAALRLLNSTDRD